MNTDEYRVALGLARTEIQRSESVGDGMMKTAEAENRSGN